MSVVAIIGAGPIGASVAHSLAERARVREIRLFDANATTAAGKALDILQSGPVGGFDTRVVGAADVLGATGADVIVLADESSTGEWTGERGLAMVAQLMRAGTKGPLVFAGPSQLTLMETCAIELHVPIDRMIATAPGAMVGAVQALTSVELNIADVDVAVVGRPPKLVVGWSSARAGGALVTEQAPAHRLLAISESLKHLWPPGPYAIAAVTAQVVEALISGGRRRIQAAAISDGELDLRGRALMLPLELGRGRILARQMPSLSAVERGQASNPS